MVAMVEAVIETLAPAQASYDERLVRRACQPGRVRGTALAIYEDVLANPRYADRTLSQSLRMARHLHSRERRFVADGLYGLLRFHRLIDALLDAQDLPPDPMARWLGWLICQGLPPPDAASAYAEAVDTHSIPFARLHSPLLAAQQHLLELPPAHQFAVLGSFPSSIAQRVLRSTGDACWDFLAASNQRAPVVLRVNTTKTTPSELADILREREIHTEPTHLAHHGLRLIRPANLLGDPGFSRGLFEIQDEGSQLIAELVQAEPGAPIVDYCAGAGGKTLAMACLAPKSPILAMDVRKKSLEQLRKRVRRTGGLNLKVAHLDRDGTVGKIGRSWYGRGHRVLVDAPCSGLGTLRRHPEQRLRWSDDELADLPKLQATLLHRATNFLTPQGRLLYVTCSILDEENEAVVSHFLSTHPQFTVLPLSTLLGEERAHALGDGIHLKIGPHTHGTDGFFAAVLARKPTAGTPHS